MTPPQDDPIGSVGDEAAKLFGALADWAGDHLGERVGERVGDRLRDVDGHIATGDPECLYCPVCRTVHAVRGASPELKAQLAGAAATFLQAAAGLLSAAAGSEPTASRVERIDLDDDGPDDPDDPDDPADPAGTDGPDLGGETR
jgi:hypothetical protein